MHNLQHDFLTAFRAWDGFVMGEVLIKIATTLAGRECSRATKEDLVWSCRELLESMEVHPGIGYLIEVPEGPFTLVGCAGAKWTPSPGTMLHSNLTIEMRVRSDGSHFEQRWEELGFSSETVEIPRGLVNTRVPLKDEPGYNPSRDGSPTIHKPTTIEPIPPSHTYAHACAVERTESNEWLERYARGDREQVWAEILDLGPAVRDPNFLPDAIAVVRETMRRCRTNVEKIVHRLREIDYPFQYPDDAYTPPELGFWDRITAIEENVGAVPIAMAAWYEIVGGVTLIPDLESEWNETYSDPLVVFSSDYVLEYNEDNWYRYQYLLDISPDDYHKAGVSGGPPYQIKLPNVCADGPLHGESHATTFVEYLRLSFAAGGFPGGLGKSARARWTKKPLDLLQI